MRGGGCGEEEAGWTRIATTMTATGTTTNTAAGAAARGSRRWGGNGSARLGDGCSVGGRTASTTAGQGRRSSGTCWGRSRSGSPPSRVNDDDDEEGWYVTF